MTSSNGNIFRVTGHLLREFTGEFPAQRPVTRSFEVFFDLGLNERLSKQSWGWWFETPSRPLWRHSNELKWRSGSSRCNLQSSDFLIMLKRCIHHCRSSVSQNPGNYIKIKWKTINAFWKTHVERLNTIEPIFSNILCQNVFYCNLFEMCCATGVNSSPHVPQICVIELIHHRFRWYFAAHFAAKRLPIPH